jgi:cephalosporin hydroxylase
MLNGISVLNANEFEFNGVPFRVVRDNYDSHKTTSEQIVVLKGLEWFEYYSGIIEKGSIAILFELGIWEGGSAILFALLYPQVKIISIDFAKAKPAVFDWIAKLGLSDRIKLSFGISQDDEVALTRIMLAEAPAGIGLVIDDASHHLEMTKRSFEIVFPHFIRGGTYVVEDWAWAHQQGTWQTSNWLERPALTNLLFQFVMLVGGCPDLVSELVVIRRLCRLRKAGNYSRQSLNLDKMYPSRNKTLNLI